MRNPSVEDIRREIAEAEQRAVELGEREMRLWQCVHVPPTRWQQGQYPGAGTFWVIALTGDRCLYLTPVEVGRGWGRYTRFGTIDGYHRQQDEIEHSIYQVLFAIDHGGRLCDERESWLGGDVVRGTVTSRRNGPSRKLPRTHPKPHLSVVWVDARAGCA